MANLDAGDKRYETFRNPGDEFGSGNVISAALVVPRLFIRGNLAV